MPDGRSEIDKFDEVAHEYSELHAQNIKLSGEPIGYFAQYKIDRVKRLGVPPTASILDFGCGIGNLTELLAADFSSVVGYDPSRESLEVARQRLPRTEFVDDPDKLKESSFDAAILAGVLHHVPVVDRREVLATAFHKVKLGGLVIVFEHNPYNPLTLRAVHGCPFDDDAVLLRPREVRTLLRSAGYADIVQDYIVFFPRAMAALRPLEPSLRWFGMGAQTMTIGRRPA